MQDKVETVSIRRHAGDSTTDLEDVIVREFPLTIILNDQEMVTLLCTPDRLKELAVGFLFSEGLLQSRDEIKSITIHEGTGVARVQTAGGKEIAGEALFRRLITSGCGRGASFYSATDVDGQKVESPLTVTITSILNLARQFQLRSETFRTTGGVHSAALCDGSAILAFAEDIGRHNAMDKVFGECLLRDIRTEDRMVLTSGRISSEIILKVARRKAPVLVSRSAPTSMGVRLALDLGITLVGFARGKRANVYANGWRVTDNRKPAYPAP